MPLIKLKYLLTISLLILGCNSSTVGVVDIATAVPPVLPSETDTPIPTQTRTAIPSQTSVPVQRFSPAPTLEPDQADKFFKDLLLENYQCVAPCFVGIVPGITTLEEVNSLFIPSDPWYDCELSENSTGRCDTSHKFDTGLSINIQISIFSGIVKNLKVINTLPQNQSRTTRKEWSIIAPETIIQQYGTPSEVAIFYDFGPTPTYGIDMYFVDSNVIYSFLSYELKVNGQICPTIDKIEGVIIWIGENPKDVPSRDKPSLEDVSSLTKEDFSKLLTQDIDGACFFIKK